MARLPSPRAPADQMPAALAALLLVAGLLAGADAVLGRLPAGTTGLRRPGVLDALGGVRRAVAAPAPDTAPLPVSAGSLAALARINAMFVEAAAGTRSRLRIAYLGDSLIEGDLITSELRAQLQAQLGGRGVGFVPLALPHAHVRDTIRATTGAGWEYRQLPPHGAAPGPWGLHAGYAHAPADPAASWAAFEGGLARWRGDLPSADLYYGAPPPAVLSDPPTVRVASARGAVTLTLTGTGPVNRVRVLEAPSASLRLAFAGAANLPLYGVSFESAGGVLLDSFGLRGSTGGELAALSPDLLRGFQAALRYDLVILHFGVNVLYPEPGDYRRYRRTLRATITHLAGALPGVPILVISASDRGWMGPDGLGSHPHLPSVVAAQHDAAEDTGAAFFDLYRAMGAPGAMVRWATATPPLARKDFTHFNVAGAREVARLIKKHLVGGHRARPH